MAEVASSPSGLREWPVLVRAAVAGLAVASSTRMRKAVFTLLLWCCTRADPARSSTAYARRDTIAGLSGCRGQARLERPYLHTSSPLRVNEVLIAPVGMDVQLEPETEWVAAGQTASVASTASGRTIDVSRT